MFTSRARRAAAGTLMVAGLVMISAPLSASAHTGNLFTWTLEDRGQGVTVAGFSVLSQDDVSTTFLSAAGVIDLTATGADICQNQETWGVGDVEEFPVVYSWNHDTGALSLSDPTSIDNPGFFPGADTVTVTAVWSADSLPDCTKLAYVEYAVDVDGVVSSVITVSSVDPASGNVTAIVALPSTSGDAEIIWHGIATNPITGVTYLFLNIEGDPFYSILDRSVPSTGVPVLMQGLTSGFAIDGEATEADFQPDGLLWMLYEAQAESGNFQLISFAAGANLETAEPAVLGAVNTDPTEGPYNRFPQVLTYDPLALAATGTAPTGLLIAGGALLVAGAALVSWRVRRAR